MSNPTANGANGRDPRGRFAPGNPGGPGNPFARRVARLRAALIEAVTEDDIRELASGLVTAAKGGDVAAARLLLGYVVGRPPEHVDEPTLPVDLAQLPVGERAAALEQRAHDLWDLAERERRTGAEGGSDEAA